jgi:formate hydrogenlyase transcriptional activator
MTTLSISPLAQSLGEVPPDNIIFGHSEAMQSVRSRLGKVAAANVPVLITGESGTGKDIIARLIHSLSPWRVGPYVKVNCPAIPGTLLESELFGYEKGAFTGAVGSKPGRVEMAHRGTLFLDEISELDPSLQSKLLQLLQDGQFCRIGAQEDKKVEVRVVCATNRQLETDIEAGTFRQDLYYRINVVNIRMPSLRERRGDIEDLCGYFLEYYNRKFNCRARPLSNEVLAVLQKYHWPGNIRELENLIERAVIVSPGPVLRVPLIELKPPSEPVADNLTLRAAERDHILKALEATKWVLAGPRGAAARLGMKRTTLQSKMRKLGVARNRKD